MKRTGPPARHTPLTGDPATHRAWQTRSAQAAAARARELSSTAVRKGVHRAPDADEPQPRRRRAPRRNDGPWRDAVLARRGWPCRASSDLWGAHDGPMEIDHVHPRGQGGRSDVENGTPLCRRHHQLRTDNRLRYTRAMLDGDQLPYLHEVGWVWWDADTGDVYGRGRNHFEPGPSRHDARPQP